LLQDVRHAARHIRWSWRYSASVIALLAFGISTNVAVFAGLHALLIQPLPYKDPHQLVRIWESNPAIRVAVGASAGQIMRLILHEGLRICVAGVLCGIAAALVAGRGLAWLLPELGSPHTAVVCGTVVFAFAVSLVASYIPATRAARVDPAAALRAE
jgi:hypothetical protein